MSTYDTANIFRIGLQDLHQDTASYLETVPVSEWPIAGGTYSGGGFFFYAVDDEGEAIPAGVFQIMRLARQHGCDYVLIYE